jgi:hypothetical protein
MTCSLYAQRELSGFELSMSGLPDSPYYSVGIKPLLLLAVLFSVKRNQTGLCILIEQCKTVEPDEVPGLCYRTFQTGFYR